MTEVGNTANLISLQNSMIGVNDIYLKLCTATQTNMSGPEYEAYEQDFYSFAFNAWPEIYAAIVEGK